MCEKICRDKEETKVGARKRMDNWNKRKKALSGKMWLENRKGRIGIWDGERICVGPPRRRSFWWTDAISGHRPTTQWTLAE